MLKNLMLAATLAAVIAAPTAAGAQQRVAPELEIARSPQPDSAAVSIRAPGAARSEGTNPWLIGAGAVVGGAVGGAIGCAINSDDYGVYCGGQSDTTVFVSAAIGAAIGGIAVWLLTRH